MSHPTITRRYTPIMAGRRGSGDGGGNVVPMNSAAVALRRTKALELRVSGMDPVEIARELKVAPATAHAYITEALAMLPPPDIEEARRLELARLDMMQLALSPQIKHGNPDAIRAAIPLTQERMKIVGGYAASKVDATVTTQTEADRALADMLREARLQMEARQKTILEAEVVADDAG